MAKSKVLERGQKRMLHIKIWQNESFSSMSSEARLLYIGLIILADDDGRLKGNSVLLKSLIFPFDAKMSLENFKLLIKEVLKSKLVEIYRVKGEYFISHPNWDRYQSIRADLYKPSLYPENTLQKCNEPVTSTKQKRTLKERKGKERKGKELETYLSNIPKEDLEEMYQRFDCTKKQIISKGEQLLNYCNMHGKSYKDYKAFLLNAIKGDFKERDKPLTSPPKPQDKPDEVLTTQKNKPIPEDIKNSIKAILGNSKI